MENGPVPDTADFIQKMEQVTGQGCTDITLVLARVVINCWTGLQIQKIQFQDKMNKKEGATTDNRSFLAKYWMYIVPIVIFMAINGATSPENGGGR